ncbi:hypothetical protein RFI_03462 [Reticulomyxa filosa]|uniref:Uncharacterized protein n=1 Tax=Reticulomyxa filosa TaxID=46433 RepID=X6P517_RETFI|nr:hypothetical protein RFI_03462 [Reticulomyxa filosa]|eukprot:ETO33640.1 hypothetical protein RFI_03462 [Reticulomyxa filosa]
MFELGWPTILVALFFMLVTQLMFVHNLTQKKNALKITENNYERKRRLNTDVRNITCSGQRLQLKRTQTVLSNNYQKVFSRDNKDNKFYFGRGDIQFCDRFDAVFSARESSQIVSSAYIPTNDVYFGHVECLVVKSPQMEFCNETDHNVGWTFAVYCAPEYRGKGLPPQMIRKAMQHLSAFVACVCTY